MFTLYFVRALSVRGYVWRGSAIPPTKEEPRPKRLVEKQLFDTFKSLLSLIFIYYFR